MTTRDHLRREVVGEMRGERCGEGVEVVALVAAEAARGDHFLDVRVGRARGELSSQRVEVGPSSGFEYGLDRHDLVRQMVERACSAAPGT